MTLASSNYQLPAFRTHDRERCRDCQEKARAPTYGNSIVCRAHGDAPISHSHRCDRWHPRGTLV